VFVAGAELSDAAEGNRFAVGGTFSGIRPAPAEAGSTPGRLNSIEITLQDMKKALDNLPAR
jgi:hypothetical protein